MAAAIIAGTPGVGRTKTCREKRIAAVPVLTGLLLNDEYVRSQIAVDGLILCLRNKYLSLKEVNHHDHRLAEDCWTVAAIWHWRRHPHTTVS
jgi:hypothetical protein